MVLDTGSDVVWTQCLPCNKCYPQSDPRFNPKKSATFVSVKCGSPLCLQLDSRSCNRKTVVLHFVGADVLSPVADCLIPVDSKRTFCFAFAGMSGLSIIGNIQQQGFRVVYNFPGSRVGFSPSGCS
ncbi:hypothetical protein ACSBR1_016788 [Camellia fascicularis]